MGDFLGGLFGAGASLLGGEVSAQSAQAINAANRAQQAWIATGGNLSQLVSNAKAAGLSPLAVSGGTMSGQSVVPGQFEGAGISAAGQDIGRAVGALADAQTRKNTLQDEYLKSQIRRTDAEGALFISQARRMAGPGTPKPESDLNKAIFGKEPQWPAGIPGDLAMGLLKGIDKGAAGLDWLGGKMGQSLDWLRAHGVDQLSAP